MVFSKNSSATASTPLQNFFDIGDDRSASNLCANAKEFVPRSLCGSQTGPTHDETGPTDTHSYLAHHHPVELVGGEAGVGGGASAKAVGAAKMPAAMRPPQIQMFH